MQFRQMMALGLLITNVLDHVISNNNIERIIFEWQNGAHNLLIVVAIQHKPIVVYVDRVDDTAHAGMSTKVVCNASRPRPNLKHAQRLGKIFQIQ